MGTSGVLQTALLRPGPTPLRPPPSRGRCGGSERGGAAGPLTHRSRVAAGVGAGVKVGIDWERRGRGGTPSLLPTGAQLRLSFRPRKTVGWSQQPRELRGPETLLGAPSPNTPGLSRAQTPSKASAVSPIGPAQSYIIIIIWTRPSRRAPPGRVKGVHPRKAPVPALQIGKLRHGGREWL